MGEPGRGKARSPYLEYIEIRGARGEPKHPSTLRKGKDSLSSGERKGSSSNSFRESVRALRNGGRWHREGLLHQPDSGRGFLGERHWEGLRHRVRVPYPKERTSCAIA